MRRSLASTRRETSFLVTSRFSARVMLTLSMAVLSDSSVADIGENATRLASTRHSTTPMPSSSEYMRASMPLTRFVMTEHW